LRQPEFATGVSETVCPSTCTPVDATPPPASLKVTAMLCTPLTGPPDPNMALEGPTAIVGTALSVSAMSARETRTAAASPPLSAWQVGTHCT
jgi:DNA-binding beta-propeller fold protein YncE